MAKADDIRVKDLLRTIMATHQSEGVPFRHWETDHLAFAMAAVDKFSEALPMIDFWLDEFLSSLAEWYDSLEKKHLGLTTSILRETTRIVGWVRSDWREIHNELVKEGIDV